PEKTESVWEDLEHAFREDQSVTLGLALQDLEDELLLAQAAHALDPEVFGDVVQLGDGLVLELRQIHPLASSPGILWRARIGGYSRPRRGTLGATLGDGRLRGVGCVIECERGYSAALRHPLSHTPSCRVNLIFSPTGPISPVKAAPCARPARRHSHSARSTRAPPRACSLHTPAPRISPCA